MAQQKNVNVLVRLFFSLIINKLCKLTWYIKQERGLGGFCRFK